MRTKFGWQALVCALALVAVLAGCAAPTPTLAPTATAAPTLDLQPTLAAVRTEAVLTAAAEMTSNAPTATEIPPTNTPEPTATSGPTETPLPTLTATRVFIPWTATPTATVAAYSCAITGVTPASTATIKVDQDFDAVWSIKNSGVTTWQAGNTDIAFIDGTRLHQTGDLLDLTGNVAPNGTTTVTIDMRAPASDGTYTTNWGINLEDGSVCKLTLTINVSK